MDVYFSKIKIVLLLQKESIIVLVNINIFNSGDIAGNIPSYKGKRMTTRV